ncbi:MAG: NADH-quinone oxidoreductase subunit NuoH [bacterium]|nr:NADH-quinone oxidoreductase subunit NuoH [bacterium]
MIYLYPDPGSIYENPIVYWVVSVLAILVLLFVVLTIVANSVWLERVALGRIQRRMGPNRVGPLGLLQIPADTVKMVFKESFAPRGVDSIIFVLAPAIIVVTSLAMWAVIPVGVWFDFPYWISNINVGVLFIFAMSSMNAYAFLLGGWSSNNKYSLLGGLRAAAQLISYELAWTLSLVPIFMITHSLRLQDIATYTVHWGPYNGPLPLVILAPVSFAIFMVAGVAEINRAPFDLPEAEQELIGGYLTEYSGLKFLCFYIGEYVAMLTASTLVPLIFFAGWYLWFVPPFLALLLKVLFFLLLYILLRSTVPRLRYDQLMRLGWKVLLPLALVNVIVTAVVLVAVGG